MVANTNYSVERWDKVEERIRGVMRIVEELNEETRMLYTTISNICSTGHSFKQLYVNFFNLVEEYVISVVLTSLEEKDGELLLREFGNRWGMHKAMVKQLSIMFCCINEIIARNELPTLEEVGLTCFRNVVYRELNGKVGHAVITLIGKERDGEQIDSALVKRVVDLLVEIGLGRLDAYEEYFEEHMLQNSYAYYSSEASNRILESFGLKYINKVCQCLKKERDRISCYLHSSTEPKLVEVFMMANATELLHELLKANDTQLFESTANNTQLLEIMHYWLRDDNVEHTANIFKKHITAEGEAFVQQYDDAACNQDTNAADVLEQVLVRNIHDLGEKYMKYVTVCFQNHTLFHKALKEVLETLCNSSVPGRSGAELLATVCHNILKYSQSLEAIDDILEKVLKLFAIISFKDLFVEFYRRKLACRLLFNLSHDALEKSFLTKLKHLYDVSIISNMEQMFSDLASARTNSMRDKERLQEHIGRANPGIDFEVIVLNPRFWPSYKPPSLNLPTEMVDCIDDFKRFCTSTYEKKLTLIDSMGICCINGKFAEKTIELIVSTAQAALLYLFDASDRLSYSEIMTQLNLSHDVLYRLLYSLSLARYKILVKEPNTKTISQTDYFVFNFQFTDRMDRIEMAMDDIDTPPSEEEMRSTMEYVKNSRKDCIDAAIVRIMKHQKKALSQEKLVEECVKLLRHRFTPATETIKELINSLITRDYLERDEEQPNLLRYKP